MTSSQKKTVIIAGGGTGGHLFAGLAVAEELRRLDVEVVFVGTQRGLEARIVPQRGFALRLLQIGGLKGQGLLGTLKTVFQLPRSLWQATKILRQIRPVAVLGVGGYASGPLALMSSILRIPTLILEQNSVPGLTNRLLAAFVRKILIAFPETKAYFPAKKIEYVGNPIRAELVARKTPYAPHEKRLHVLILGGSQGAHALNELMVETMAVLKMHEIPVTVFHQTGKNDETFVREKYMNLGMSDARADAFIDDMSTAYAEADLVVSRAGATTLTELFCQHLPSLLVPLPTATDDHQTRNAEFAQAVGAARIFPQTVTTPSQLADVIIQISADRESLLRMSNASASLAKPDAAAKIALMLFQLPHS